MYFLNYFKNTKKIREIKHSDNILFHILLQKYALSKKITIKQDQ